MVSEGSYEVLGPREGLSWYYRVAYLGGGRLCLGSPPFSDAPPAAAKCLVAPGGGDAEALEYTKLLRARADGLLRPCEVRFAPLVTAQPLVVQRHRILGGDGFVSAAYVDDAARASILPVLGAAEMWKTEYRFLCTYANFRLWAHSSAGTAGAAPLDLVTGNTNPPEYIPNVNVLGNWGV